MNEERTGRCLRQAEHIRGVIKKGLRVDVWHSKHSSLCSEKAGLPTWSIMCRETKACNAWKMALFVKSNHGYVPLVVNTSRSFPHSWLITGFETWLTRREPLVEQELPTLSEHLSLPPVYSGVRVTRSIVLCVCFVDRCLSFCTFFFWPLCCLFLFDLRVLNTPWVSFRKGRTSDVVNNVQRN
jgi:hypothetical protein